MDTHLYLSCYRAESLIASQLDPEAFGKYMAVGAKELTSGHVMFLEVDPDFRSDDVDLADLDARCAPHPDGSPKRSLYLAIYRVLEHIPRSAIGDLYLVTRDGRVLRIEGGPYAEEGAGEAPHLYQELCPTTPLVAASLPPGAFVNYLTDPANDIHVPRLFFAELALEFDAAGRIAERLPYRHPGHIEECIRELQNRAKQTKTVDRAHSMAFFYRAVQGGFYLGDPEGVTFYPFPSREELQKRHHTWWRSASMGL
jgi:hypothetical protein